MTNRQGAILEILRTRDSATVAELAATFELTEASIRLDLADLQAAGLIRRFHGGARIAPASAFEKRLAHRTAEKAAIARAAITHVQSGETLYMGYGSTVFLLAKELTGVEDLTIVTNSIPVLSYLGMEMDKKVVVVGGEYSHDDRCCFGGSSESPLRDIFVSKVFMGADCVDVESGFVFSQLRTLDYIEKIISNARQTILLADSTKFGRIRGMPILDLAHVSVIVTDDGLPEDTREKIRQRGLGLEIAG